MLPPSAATANALDSATNAEQVTTELTLAMPIQVVGAWDHDRIKHPEPALGLPELASPDLCEEEEQDEEE
jgi:hypothetical protein